MKMIKVGDIFTQEMIELAMTCKSTNEIEEKVIKPNMEEINRKSGQENDSRYMSYAMEFAISQLRTRGSIQ